MDELLNKDQALALFYDGGQAPVVSDQKTGEAAQKLIQQALDMGIPIYENPQLLEQLSELQMGQQVPTELYQLIAEILAFAFFIQGKAPPNYQGGE